MELTFGSDPEFMLQRDGRFYSAIGLVPGTKYKRHDIGRHQAYYDNVMAECAVAPAAQKEEFIANIRDCLQRYAQLVAPFKLVPQASAEYPTDELKSKESQEIGCDPEFCAYDLAVAKPPQDEFRNGTLRTAGGHIHLGTPIGRETFGLLAIVRMLDLFLGTTSIYLDKDQTTAARKALYGKAGRFRQPEWGVEYRSLSNFWIASPKLVSLVFDICTFVVQFVKDGGYDKMWEIDMAKLNDDNSWGDPNFHPKQCHHCKGYDADALRSAIDTMNQEQGKAFLAFIRGYLPDPIFREITTLAQCGPYDFYKEWGLK